MDRGDQMSGISILPLVAGSPHWAEVRRLLDENSGTLGFFPDGALTSYADRGGVLIASLIGWTV